ncbi:MAG: DUF4347 domain-containing protein, partial [Candidatus Omnitrophica bacterium]|nr:DUF4347 domain-containing protein [Candidatus Omnitrophota bacterium]
MIDFEALEPRVLFSATPSEPTASEPIGDSSYDSVEVQYVAEPKTDESAETPAMDGGSEDSAVPSASEENLSQNDVQTRREFVFISAGIDAPESLVSQIPENYSTYLIQGDDGLAQIASLLEGQTDIDAIHLVTHGEAGRLFLGNDEINSDTMASDFAAEFGAIGAALSESGDILVYGCDFGAGDSGETAVNLMAHLTGADIAASNDDTGYAALGGDWDLETRNGEIETSPLAATNWRSLLSPTDADDDGVLNTVDIDDDNDGILDTDEQQLVTSAPVTSTLSYNATASAAAAQVNGQPVIILTGGGITVTISNEAGAEISGNRVTTNSSSGFSESIRVTATSASGTVLIQGLRFTDLDNFDRNTYVDALALDVDGTWSNLTNSSSSISLTAYSNNAAGEAAATSDTSETVSFADLRAQGAVSPVILNPNNASEDNYQATFTLTTAASTFRVFGSDAVLPFNQVTEFAFNTLPITYVIQSYQDIDTDGDGVVNRLDIDSDNDGITDNVEA